MKMPFEAKATDQSAAILNRPDHRTIPRHRHDRLPPFALWLLTFTLCLRVLGLQYSIYWHKISGGGGTSTNGQIAVSGTIGQHDAGGPMTGGGYSLTGGFWTLYALETPGAPLLSIKLTSTNAAMVCWPWPSSGFMLQQNSDLNTTNWVTPSEIVSNNGTVNYIIVNPPVGNRFYRLKK